VFAGFNIPTSYSRLLRKVPFGTKGLFQDCAISIALQNNKDFPRLSRLASYPVNIDIILN